MLFSRKLLLQDQIKFDDQTWTTPGEYKLKLPAGRYKMSMVGGGGAGGVTAPTYTIHGSTWYGGTGGCGGTGRYYSAEFNLTQPIDVTVYVGRGGAANNPDGVLGRGGAAGVKYGNAGNGGAGGASGYPSYVFFPARNASDFITGWVSTQNPEGTGTNAPSVTLPGVKTSVYAYAAAGGGGGGGGGGASAYSRYDTGGPGGGGGGSVVLQIQPDGTLKLVELLGQQGANSGNGGAGPAGKPGVQSLSSDFLPQITNGALVKSGSGGNGSSWGGGSGQLGYGASGAGGGAVGNTGSGAGGGGGAGAGGLYASGGSKTSHTNANTGDGQAGDPWLSNPVATVDPEGNLVEVSTDNAIYGQGGGQNNRAGGDGWVRITRLD